MGKVVAVVGWAMVKVVAEVSISQQISTILAAAEEAAEVPREMMGRVVEMVETVAVEGGGGVAEGGCAADVCTDGMVPIMDWMEVVRGADAVGR